MWVSTAGKRTTALQENTCEGCLVGHLRVRWSFSMFWVAVQLYMPLVAMHITKVYTPWLIYQENQQRHSLRTDGVSQDPALCSD